MRARRMDQSREAHHSVRPLHSPEGATLRLLHGNARIAAVAYVCDGTPSGMSVRMAPPCQDHQVAPVHEFVRKRGPGEGQSL
jgi:hypothetical protein